MLRQADEMCSECFRLWREHTIAERRRCQDLPPLLERPPDPEPAPPPVGLTINEVELAVAETLPDEHPDSDVSRAGIFLLSAFQVGTSNKQLRAFTGLPWTVINNGGFYARHAGIWSRRGNRWEIVVEWDAPGALGVVAFTLDCMVAAGRIVRETSFNADGSPWITYRARNLGDYSATQIDGLEDIPWSMVARPELREQRRLARAAT